MKGGPLAGSRVAFGGSVGRGRRGRDNFSEVRFFSGRIFW